METARTSSSLEAPLDHAENREDYLSTEDNLSRSVSLGGEGEARNRATRVSTSGTLDQQIVFNLFTDAFGKETQISASREVGWYR